MLLAQPRDSQAAIKDRSRPLLEYGFWDYTTPGAGGMEAYRQDDYVSLLDDMARAGMNSLMILVKWLTTGYRSRLPFQDQSPDNPVTASDNSLLRWVIEEAGKRKIKIWLGGAVTYFDVTQFEEKPYRTYHRLGGFDLPVEVGLYDTDTPGLIERIVQIYRELVESFPGAGGLLVELEGAGLENSHRIPLYNRWAEENGRPPFRGHFLFCINPRIHPIASGSAVKIPADRSPTAHRDLTIRPPRSVLPYQAPNKKSSCPLFRELAHPLNPRSFDVPAWRDYTTHSRLKVLQAVEDGVRAKGFGGGLAMICETGSSPYAMGQAVNLKEFRTNFPHWIATTYEYNKWEHRYAMMDLCIDQPKQEGIRVFYLPRGVMTWGDQWPLPISLEQSWQMELEDIRKFKPQGVWWFGSGAGNEGAHVSLSRLEQAGYGSGEHARQTLLEVTSELRAR